MNILITGTSRGIGYELVTRFSSLGGNTIFAVSRDEKKITDLAISCNSANPESEVVPLVYDLSKLDNIDPMIRKIENKKQSIDILINNAGFLINKAFSELNQSEIESIYRVNVTLPMLLIQSLLPFLSKSNQAHVVNISSMGGFQGSAKFPGLAVYASSKAAIASLTECLAEEFKYTTIKFNCLALGAVATEMLAEAFPGYQAPVTPNEMAKFITEFALTGSQYFNGKIIPVARTTP